MGFNLGFQNIYYCISASFPNAFSAQTAAQLQQAAANSPAGKQTEGMKG